jgi:hypothetical protein
MFVAELVLPFFLFGPRLLRRLAFLGIFVFQALIGATGNYGFFNLLTAVLCLVALDDEDLRSAIRFLPERWRRRMANERESPRQPATSKRGPRQFGWPNALAWASATLVLLLSFGATMLEIVRTVPYPPRSAWARSALSIARATTAPFRPALNLVAPLRSINGYGLFRAMTRERPEIGIEVSDDGRNWRELAFRFKPGDPTQAPRWAAVHMPRLDWQMWFAALAPERERWLSNFLAALLERREPVVALLAPGTLPETPTWIRLRMWNYRFSTEAERKQHGAWWVRDDLGLLAGPFAASTIDSP